MQEANNILIIGICHLLLLIIAVYMIAYVRVYCSVHFSETDVLLLVLQTLNLLFLLQYISGYQWNFLKSVENIRLMVVIQSIFILLLPVRIIWAYRIGSARRRQLLMPQSIRESIDYMPGGIGFSADNGKPILVNRKLNELVYKLTNHYIINLFATWDELQHFKSANGCVKLDDFHKIMEIGGGADKDSKTEFVVIMFPDNSVWRFLKESLMDRRPFYIQLVAVDITGLYQNSKKLYENNIRLAEQYVRQQNLLANIVEINRKKEMLSTKMKIHDDLGRSIIMTKHYLHNKNVTNDALQIVETWNRTIRNLLDFTQLDPDFQSSPDIELQKAADMIGCSIHYSGERPDNRKTTLLFYAAVREALTNAVTHANANQLYVASKRTDSGYYINITDNGNIQVHSISEGSGLGNLRKRLEQEGATLKINCVNGVELNIMFPAI